MLSRYAYTLYASHENSIQPERRRGKTTVEKTQKYLKQKKNILQKKINRFKYKKKKQFI